MTVHPITQEIRGTRRQGMTEEVRDIYGRFLSTTLTMTIQDHYALVGFST